MIRPGCPHRCDGFANAAKVRWHDAHATAASNKHRILKCYVKRRAGERSPNADHSRLILVDGCYRCSGNGIANSGFQFGDVFHHRFAPAVNVRPLAIAHAVAVAGYVDHVTLGGRRWNLVVRLLVGDNH